MKIPHNYSSVVSINYVKLHQGQPLVSSCLGNGYEGIHIMVFPAWMSREAGMFWTFGLVGEEDKAIHTSHDMLYGPGKYN